MPALITGHKKLSWHERKGVTELLIGGPAFATACIVTWRLLIDPKTNIYGWISVATLAWLALGLVLKILQASKQDKKESAGTSHDGIHGALYVVHAAASHACGLQMDAGLEKIRVTFHRVIFKDDGSDPTEYEQIFDYVGRKGGGVDRKFSVAIGISGKAIRSGGDAIKAKRKNANVSQYEQELIDDWGYTAQAAKQVSREPMTWLAVPVRDSDTDKTIGIVYLDSTDPSAFDADVGVGAILTACLGVTKYVGVRYGK